MAFKFRLPKNSERVSVLGKTGSGKTQAAVWQLSQRDFNHMPWIVYDFKLDPLINSIDGVEHLELSDPLPKQPGIYLVHPHPDDIDGVRDQMWKIWEAENTGVYIDEGYMVCGPDKRNPAFRSLLTQGRSKRIPMMVLSQRPVWLDRFAFSESEYYQVFSLNDARDRASVRAFVPADLDQRLPDYHSYWYDVPADKVVVLQPVPGKDAILGAFAAKFELMKQQNTKRFTFI